MIKNPDFLNLEIPDNQTYKTENGKHYNFTCRLKELHNKHSLHTESAHLNAITDLLINLGLSLQKESLDNKQKIDKIQKNLETNIIEIKRLSENLDYFKNQNELIIKTLKNLEKIKIDKEETAKDIDKITEAINKLSLEDIKLNRQPKPYKHWEPRK